VFCWLLASFLLVGTALAHSQSQTTPPPQQQSQQTQSSTGGTPNPATSKAATDKDSSAPVKVYRNHDVKELPPGGVSVVGSATPAQSDAKKTPAPALTQEDKDAQAAAYWKARFTAARNKLAADQKALPILQAQLNQERVEEWSVNECTQQVNSDTFLSIQNQIEATKLAISQDKQALKDLHEEFRRAGGLPGWIR
jgi:hypothetical protein